MTRFVVGFALAMGATGAGAQVATSGSNSTPQMVRAAGMPLPDGSLAPGSLTVRVVQGAFAGDLSGIPVEIEIDSRERRQALTAEKGRAEFAHLPIGARVRASAVVGSERLEADPFPMPTESGVRVLLVTAADHDPTGGAAPVLMRTPPAGPSPLAALPPHDTAAGVTAVRVTVVSLTILAFALVAAHRWHRGRS